MKIEIISIGTEIILGDIVDTNSQYLARELTGLGYDIHYINSVGDNRSRIHQILDQAIRRADIVITTGGLGPTDDDLTREIISEVTGRELRLDEELLNNLKCFFADRGYKMTSNNEKQACLPEGAEPLRNETGTAPGVLLEMDGCTIISMPGVPREMKHIFKNEVTPYLKKKNDKIIKSKILNFFGIGESSLETEIKDILDKQSNPTLALLAGSGEVKLRITAKGKTDNEVEKMIAQAESEIKERVGRYIYGENDQGLEGVAGDLLNKSGLTISLAESCTGGLVGSRITDIPGSSTYFMGGMMVYSNQAKMEQLGVKEETLEKYGAVSEDTAREMSENIRKIMKTDIGVSLTGIAGPGGGTEEKPVGLVYIGVATADSTNIYQLNLGGDRERNKWMSSQYALFYVYNYLMTKKGF